ncbi:hypothetical protein [Microbacterium sp.]|uniref:hypothetical protein n=1 Tax=Microbacterium sp. TaxID=51671 RepID=UPI003A8EBC52
MRLITRIPAARGRVTAVSVRVRYDGDTGADPIDVTDIMLQPGEPTGVVPHPADLAVTTGGRRWRNGVITRTVDEVIILANDDRAAPTTLTVTPAGPVAVRVGSFRFGQITGPATADGVALTSTAGYGHVPVITERADGHLPVTTDRPLHLTVGWAERK